MSLAGATGEQISLAEATARLTAPGQPFEMEEVVIRGAATRAWKNLPGTVRDVFETARLFADREFLIYEDDRATYDGFIRATTVLAEHFRVQGLRSGDRVALVMRNLPEWPVTFFAAALSGAIVAPLGPTLAGPELEFALNDCGARIAVVDEDVLERLTPHLGACPALETVIVSRIGDAPIPEAIARLEDLIGPVNRWGELPSRALPEVELAPDDDLTLFYTSGTTGPPKGAIGSHRNMLSIIRVGAFAQARMLLLAGREYHEPEPLKARPNCTLMIATLSHVSSCCGGLIPTMMRGGKFVFMRWWFAEKAMALIEREKVNATGGVPTIAWQLLEHPARESYDLSSLRFLQYGGAPSGLDLVRKIGETFKGSVPIQGYGMTETSSTFCNHSGPEYQARPDSCGPAAPVGDIKIMDLAGQNELPAGATGEIWLKGPQVVRGYWNKPEETARTFVGGWVRTGDIGSLDEEGRLYVVDRAKDIIIKAGENIYCGEVEAALTSHPAVLEAAVVGIPHKVFGEEPGAVVTLRSGQTASERELRIFVRSTLSPIKVPVKVVVTDKPLMRNSGGKLIKSELRNLLIETQVQR